MAKILIIDDDVPLAESLSDWLSCETHTVELVHNGADGLDRLRFYQYDLIVLDWQLPEMSGVEILKAYRMHGGTSPILMLTGKNSIDDKELGLESGADDYLTKPFNVRELGARVKALLRRPSSFVPVLNSGNNLTLDPKSMCLVRDGVQIKLLPKEFAIMEFLMRHPNRYFTPEQLLNHVWPDGSESTIDALRTCIRRIRLRIDHEGEESMIQSSRGCGYKFEPPKPSTKL